MGFKEFTGKSRHTTGDPFISIYPDTTSAHISSNAVSEYFTQWNNVVPFVTFHVDREYSRLGFELLKEETTDSYTISRDGNNASVVIKSVLKQGFGVDIGELDETVRVEPERDDETGLVVIDVSEVVERVTGAVHCPECGKRCKDESGLRIHVGSTHESKREALIQANPEEFGREVPEGDDSYTDYYTEENNA